MPFHLHLISDATGETVQGLARACLVQFEGVEVTEHHWSMIRSEAQLATVIEAIWYNPGLVLFSLMNPALRYKLQEACWQQQIPSLSVLDATLEAVSLYLGMPSKHLPGRQHVLDAEYFQRIEAMEFTLAHDDGQGLATLAEADVVLVGVSRSSKTPTSIYLANKSLKVANVPLVPGVPPPEELLQLTRPLIVGLTNTSERLIELRKTRLKELSPQDILSYTDPDIVRAELAEARRLFTAQGWPVIDVARRAIEETAAEILGLLAAREQEQRHD